MAKIEHIKNKRGEVIYPVSKEGAIYDENGVLLSTKIATFITRLVDNLANYYLKSETYTKGEVDELIGAIQGFTYIVVSELPTASAETMGIVYLVPSEDPQTQNVKDEYITIRSGVEGSYTYSWEQIGSTAIDLSGYVTTEALNTALADYTTTANLTTLLAAKQDTIADLSTIRSGAAAGATAYQKPGTGIPATDMASGVQTSLGKADSAYQKPSGGIPKTDLESGVQGSLELADTAVQADPIGSIVPPVDPSEFATKEEVEGLEHKVDENSFIIKGISKTTHFSVTDFVDGYTNTNAKNIGDSFDIRTGNPMTAQSSGGQLAIPVSLGQTVVAKMQSKSNSYCMAYIFLDTNKNIVSWAGKTSQTFNWLTNPHTFTAEQDGWLILQMAGTDYSVNVSAPLDVYTVTAENLEGLPERVSDIEGEIDGIDDKLAVWEKMDTSEAVSSIQSYMKQTNIFMSGVTSPNYWYYLYLLQGGVKYAVDKISTAPETVTRLVLRIDNVSQFAVGQTVNSDQVLLVGSDANGRSFLEFDTDTYVAVFHPNYVVLNKQTGETMDDVVKSVSELDENVTTVSNIVYGVVINSPAIETRKAIIAPEGTISSSGAADIYTETIPSGVSKIWTKFNSYGTPNNVGYAFYDANDGLLLCGPSLAGSDTEKNGVWLELAVPSGAVKFSNTVANITAYGLIKFDYEGIKTRLGFEDSLSDLEKQIQEIEEEINEDGQYQPMFHLPSRIDAVRGEKMLLFKYAMGNAINPNDITCQNAQCRDYPRYIEVNPATVGESNIEISVQNEHHDKAGTQTVKLNVFEKPTNPANVLNILVVGSSTTYPQPYEELYRRLVLTTGEEGNPSNPKGLGLSNVRFVGRKENNSGNFRYEATGGFNWANYAQPQGTNNNYAFTVSNPSAYNVGDVYTDGTYDFEITEISQDEHRVSANCATQNAPIAQSGSLSIKTGSGPASFVYSAYTATITHPFDLGNGVSLEDYMTAYCGGVSPDIIVFQDLVFNGGGVITPTVKTNMFSLIRLIHTEYPNAKMLVSSEALPSAKGGLAYNYLAPSAAGQPNVMTWRLRNLVSDTIDCIAELNEEFDEDVVMFVPKAIQCDAENDYPTMDTPVNFRVTDITEKVGTNGMHPTTNAGIYNQIDSYYRAIAYAIKKWYN